MIRKANAFPTLCMRDPDARLRLVPGVSVATVTVACKTRVGYKDQVAPRFICQTAVLPNASGCYAALYAGYVRFCSRFDCRPIPAVTHRVPALLAVYLKVIDFSNSLGIPLQLMSRRAFSYCLLVGLTLPLAAAEESDSDRRPVADASSAPTQRPAPATPKRTPSRPFVPTEKIKADSAIPFPVDI